MSATDSMDPISASPDSPEDSLTSDTKAHAESYEETHVHSVYEAIAPHFSSTRHKPWPLVSSFLLSQPPGSIGLDIGCGNGKYLPVNPNVHILGSDRSSALIHLAATEHSGTGRVLLADGLALPFRPGSVDFVISVAVIHHFSTRERRRLGISCLLDCVRKGGHGCGGGGGGGGGGKLLLYAWALEQSATSRRSWDRQSEQDALVPWVMRAKGKPEETYQRYYHLYRQGELEEDAVAAGGRVLDSGYEKDNWWVICTCSDATS